MFNPLKPPTSAPKRKRVFVLLALSLLLITGTLFLMSEEQGGTIIVTFPNGQQLETEVADTPQKIFFGLAFREKLPVNTGILYIFPTSDLHRLKTKGYIFPVDLVWLDESRFIVFLTEHADPCPEDPCPLYGPPPTKARYVIQAEAGLIQREGLKEGEELKFTLKM